MSDLGYTVKTNGLFAGEIKEPDSSKARRKGFSGQSLQNELAGIEPPERSFTLYTGPAGMEQFNRALNDALQERVSTLTTIGGADIADSDGMVTLSYMDAPEADNGTRPNPIQSSIVQGANLMDMMVPYQRHYDIMRSRLDQLVGEERDALASLPVSTLPQRVRQDILQRQLQTGQIDHITYLDLISEL